MGGAERRRGRIRAAFAAVGAGRSATGQVTVELMLVLPVFMLMLFLIMELGNLAFQTILAHHSAYELARIGSLMAGPRGGEDSDDCNRGKAEIRMRDVLCDMFTNCNNITVTAACVPTGFDRQVQDTGRKHENHDLLVTMFYPARLVFPVSNIILSDDPKQGRPVKTITVMMRMPVEKPLFQ